MSTKSILLLLSSLLLPPAMLVEPAHAQQNQGGNLSQDRRGDDATGQGENGGPSAQTAQVGAGTTNGTTTGYSGPADATEASPGGPELPRLPGAHLCEPYQATTAAYQSCLGVVLRN